MTTATVMTEKNTAMSIIIVIATLTLLNMFILILMTATAMTTAMTMSRFMKNRMSMNTPTMTRSPMIMNTSLHIS
ncbi:MAG: hypothetical protein V2I36_08015 [Desulfopila sp.]|nr:hypothetical protein [Desulfopila sp.]